jgi:sugar phosphate isomerase/epimerase
MITRREFGRIAAATASAAALFGAKIDSKVHGVMIGAQTYSFRDRPLDDAIKGMTDIGLGYAELWQGHVEPKGLKPEEMKKWRTSPESLTQMKEVKDKFDKAGIKIYAFNYSFRDNFTDEELAHGMELAKALGTKYITASSHVSIAPRIDPIAGKHGVIVAFHNHSNMKADEFARPEDFEKAMEGHPNIGINLDIGHFTAAGFDPVDYLEKQHKHIVTLHLKDRKRDQGTTLGANLPFGEGETKIKEVLTVLKTKKYPIPAMIEYEYKGGDTVAEVRKCYEFCKAALA